jgi:uncharacterized protein (DUF983 family)
MARTPSFEEGDSIPESEGRPMPCPQCGSTRGYSRMGNFRVQCLNCNSLLKNEEVNMQLSNEEQK